MGLVCETYIFELAALTSRMTLALAVGSFNPVNLRVKTVFSLGLAASSSTGSAAPAAAGAAAAAEAAGMAISVMFNLVLRCETRSAASRRVSFSIWSTMVEILASMGAALRRVAVVERARTERKAERRVLESKVREEEATAPVNVDIMMGE